MKKLNFSVLEWIILIVFLSFITLDVFFDFLLSCFDIILFSNHFANTYNFVKFLTNNTTFLCSVVWLNKILLFVAGFIPTIFFALVLRETNIPFGVKIILSIMIYYITLQLFASLIFWIFIGLLFLSYIIFKLVIHIRKKRVKSEEKIQ